jgi:hypothetical protein
MPAKPMPANPPVSSWGLAEHTNPSLGAWGANITLALPSSQAQTTQYQYPGILAGVSMLQSPDSNVGGLGMTGLFEQVCRGIGAC